MKLSVFFIVFMILSAKNASAQTALTQEEINEYSTKIYEINKNITHPNQFRCPDINIKFEVKPNYGIERISYAKLKSEINRLQTAKETKKNSPIKPLVNPNAELTIHGLTEISDSYSIHFPHQIVEKDFIFEGKEYKKYCFLSKKIIYEAGTKEIDVRIPSEYYFTNGCVKNAILVHENTHVKIFRDTLKKYNNIIQKTAEKTLSRFIRPPAKDSVDDVKDVFNLLLTEIKKIADNNWKQMHNELTELNNQFDIDEYKRDILKKKCGFEPGLSLRKRRI